MKEKNFITVILDIKNKDVWEEIKNATSSVEGFHVCDKFSHLQEPGTYDLLIMEIGDDPQKDIQFATTLKTSGIARDIFLTSSNTQPDILIEALRLGVKEFFTQPIDKDAVKKALEKIKAQKEGKKGGGDAGRKGKIINLFGSKGGVGTTTVAVNLAVSLLESGGTPSVVLVDLKPVFGDIPVNLSIEPAYSWQEITKNISRLDPTYLMSILYQHSSGIYVLPSPIELSDLYTTNPQPLATLLRFMQTMFDFIVIDSGQSIDHISQAIMKISDKNFLVSVLNLPCIINLKRLLDTFRKLGYPEEENVEIIANRFHKNTDLSLKEAEESLKKKILWTIPNAYKISMSAINQGKPLYTIAQGTEIWKKFNELAHTFSVPVDNNGKTNHGTTKKTEKGSFSLSSLFTQR